MPFGNPEFKRLMGVFAFTALSGGLWVGQQVASAHVAAKATQNVTIYVIPGNQGIKGPDGKGHDTFLPDGFVAKVGVPVHLTIINQDDMRHSMAFDSSAGLGPFVAKAGKDQGDKVLPTATSFNFTPRQAGNFRWHCTFPCDMDASDWAMGNDVGNVSTNAKGKITGGAYCTEPGRLGFMAGYVVVTK